MINPIKLAASYIPQYLPVGMTEFETFSNDVIKLAGPLADVDSMKWVIASAIQHSSQTKLSKQHFVRALKKGAANQIASAVFYSIKIKQETKIAEEKANQEQAAVTAPTEVPNVEVLPDQKV